MGPILPPMRISVRRPRRSPGHIARPPDPRCSRWPCCRCCAPAYGAAGRSSHWGAAAGIVGNVGQDDRSYRRRLGDIQRLVHRLIVRLDDVAHGVELVCAALRRGRAHVPAGCRSRPSKRVPMSGNIPPGKAVSQRNRENAVMPLRVPASCRRSRAPARATCGRRRSCCSRPCWSAVVSCPRPRRR